MKSITKAMRGLGYFSFFATLLMAINILWLVTACRRINGYTLLPLALWQSTLHGFMKAVTSSEAGPSGRAV